MIDSSGSPGGPKYRRGCGPTDQDNPCGVMISTQLFAIALPMSAGLLTTLTPAARERGHLLGGRAFAARDDRAGVAHPSPGRRGLAGDEADDRLLEMRLDPRRRLFLGGAADLANHDDGVGVGSAANSFNASMCEVPISGSPPMPMQVRLAQPEPRELVDRFVGERAALRHDADAAFLADMPRDDAGLALARRNEPGTVRADQARRRARS